MSRKYEASLLQTMKANEKTVNVMGVEVLVKPIPEGGDDGDMDPRIYKSMKNMPLLMKFMPKPKKDQTALEQILPLRKMFNDYKGAYIADEGVDTAHVLVDSTDGHKVPVRIYTRQGHGEGLPVFVYYHGGGFFGGGPDIVEQMCKLLVQNLDCVALNVDYRLCPESAYPKPLNDCWYATKWAYENAHTYGGDKTRMAVSGDSAGGNLAAAITLRDREEKTGMVKLQVLIYPAVNIAGNHTEFYHGVEPDKYHMSAKHGKVLRVVTEMMSSMLGPDGNMLDKVYLQGNEKPEHIYASPLLADFTGLPATMLIFGEHDFLVFEDFAYAQTAAKAGLRLKTIIYRGMGHGFADQIGVAPQAEDCMGEIADYMREIL